MITDDMAYRHVQKKVNAFFNEIIKKYQHWIFSQRLYTRPSSVYSSHDHVSLKRASFSSHLAFTNNIEIRSDDRLVTLASIGDSVCVKYPTIFLNDIKQFETQQHPQNLLKGSAQSGSK
jgi:hypothetical protein